MPVDGDWSYQYHKRLTPIKIPWAMIAPHDEQCKRNCAGQDLNRVWERHGMSACEALAILDDRPWKNMSPDEAHEELTQRIEIYSANAEVSHSRRSET